MRRPLPFIAVSSMTPANCAAAKRGRSARSQRQIGKEHGDETHTAGGGPQGIDTGAGIAPGKEADLDIIDAGRGERFRGFGEKLRDHVQIAGDGAHEAAAGRRGNDRANRCDGQSARAAPERDLSDRRYRRLRRSRFRLPRHQRRLRASGSLHTKMVFSAARPWALQHAGSGREIQDHVPAPRNVALGPAARPPTRTSKSPRTGGHRVTGQL